LTSDPGTEELLVEALRDGARSAWLSAIRRRRSSGQTWQSEELRGRPRQGRELHRRRGGKGLIGAGGDRRCGDGLQKWRADVFEAACRIPTSIAPAVNTMWRLAWPLGQWMSRNGSAPQRVDRVSRENTNTRQTQHGNQKFNHRRRPWHPATNTTLQRSCTVKGKACSGTVLVGSDASLHQLTSVERAVAAR
jgi:hypothetical protein